MRTNYSILLLFLLTFSVTAQNNFLNPSTNSLGLANIGQNNSTVSFGDLDGDGDLDIICGSQNIGFIYFENTGTISTPTYAAGVNNGFGLLKPVAGGFFTPRLIDLDNDGDLDLISRNNFGTIFYYENSGSATAPAFESQIQNPFNLTTISGTLYQSFTDLDNDGDLDMLAGVGNPSGNNFFYVENIGTPSLPNFTTPVSNAFNLAWSNATPNSGYSSPAFADFDDDGDIDLLSGSDTGNFYYYENIGSASAPNFADSVENTFSLTPSLSKQVFDISDIDNDGDLDLLIGGESGDFAFYENDFLDITFIPDANFEQALIDQGIDSGGVLDGQVLTSDISSLSLLNISGEDISDLTGIEGFTSLTNLNANNNSLVSVNLGTNTTLLELNLDNNSSLTGVDISGLSSLVNLNLSNCPMLNSIELNSNTGLISLVATNSSFSSIDFSSNTLIETINLSSNSIDDINVSANLNLKSLQIGDNSLTSLDVTNNTDLESLNASLNSLTEIDVTNNPNLTALRLNNNSISEIDLFSNDLLEILLLQNNNIVNIDINQNGLITQLNLADNSLIRPFLANGNNIAITTFAIFNNPSLTCITVDDVAYANANFTNKDNTANYSLDCTSEWTVFTTDTAFDDGIVNDTGADTDMNNEVSYAEALAFTGDIILNNRGISDVTGLEAFPNALEINLSDNNITDINTYLTSESFTIETRLANGNVENQQILRPKIRIKSLNVARNGLTEVDISRTEGLESLDVSGNNLTSLTVSGDASGARINTADLLFLNATNTGGGLGCIQVDNVAIANDRVNIGDWQIDLGTIFSTNCRAALSTNEFSLENSISIAPNPVNSILKISTADLADFLVLDVYDVTGKLMISTIENRINVSSIPNGVYLLKITTNKGIVSKKLIKN